MAKTRLPEDGGSGYRIPGIRSWRDRKWHCFQEHKRPEDRGVRRNSTQKQLWGECAAAPHPAPGLGGLWLCRWRRATTPADARLSAAAALIRQDPRSLTGW